MVENDYEGRPSKTWVKGLKSLIQGAGGDWALRNLGGSGKPAVK